MGWARQRSKRCCTASRSLGEFRAWCYTPAISPVRGRRSRPLVDWVDFEGRVGAEHAGATRAHVARSIAAAIDRAGDILGYRPRYSSLDALHESLGWLVANGQVDVGGQDF
jgi:hypothetical protein